MNVLERFLKYVSYGTNSDEDCEECPSSPKQLELAEYLKNELEGIGVSGVQKDGKGYVYGFIPGEGALAGEKPIGFIAHMDTSPSVPGDNIKASVVNYNGGDILLADGKTVISEADFPEIKALSGERLVVTDGTTLLGADDKAGVAEIVTLCERLMSVKNHRPVAVAFTPDEEIGRGTDFFSPERFGAREAYTIDGGIIGEIEYENFNAASLSVRVSGVNIHPGSGKNRMKNAILLANEFISMLPPFETPAHTEGYEGFYHISSISGNETLCTFCGIIRDHDRCKFEERKAFALKIGEFLNEKYGEGTFMVEVSDSYYNMREKIEPCMYLVDNAKKAFEKAGVEPRVVPIRGGTDGAHLSYMGVPCPNLSTGGYNFHSCREFIPVSAMEKMVEVLESLAE